MEKPKQIREVLTRCVPHLKTNPDKLHIFIAPGNVESTGARSLSFEWQYPLTIGIEDFAGHPDQIMVPLLAWLRQRRAVGAAEVRRELRHWVPEYAPSPAAPQLKAVDATAQRA